VALGVAVAMVEAEPGGTEAVAERALGGALAVAELPNAEVGNLAFGALEN
jgi:hypothetical protein